MTQASGSTNSEGAPTREPILLLLYGSLEHDGRAQRVLDVMQAFGVVSVLDVATNAGVASSDNRVSVFMPPRAGILHRHLRFWWSAVVEARRIRPKLIVGADFLTTIPAVMTAKLANAAFIYDAHELIIPEPGIRMSWRERFWYTAEKIAVRRANMVIAANEERARLMQEHYDMASKPLVMRNIPAQTGRRIAASKILADYPCLARNYPAERLLIYQGNLSYSRGIDRFIKALSYLPKEYRMVIVGNGPDAARLREIGSPFDEAGRLTFLGHVENRLLHSITMLADVGIVTYPFSGQNNIHCASNKIYEYAQAGLPVVATSQPPLKSLVTNYNIGELVGPDDDSRKIAATLRRVGDWRQLYASNTHGVVRDHCWELEAIRVREAVARVIDPPLPSRSTHV